MLAKSPVPIDSWPTIAPTGDIRVGRIVAVESGRPYVVFDGVAGGDRLLARVALRGADAVPEKTTEARVLLVLENGDPAMPIIVGFVSDVLPERPPSRSAQPDDDPSIAGRQVSIEGRDAVSLRCGQASITLRADGQVIVKGTRLTSRASETNKVRGATVLIN